MSRNMRKINDLADKTESQYKKSNPNEQEKYGKNILNRNLNE